MKDKKRKKDKEFIFRKFLAILHRGDLNDDFKLNLNLLENNDAIFDTKKLEVVISSIPQEVEEFSNPLTKLDFVFRYALVLSLIKNQKSKSIREKLADCCKKLINENSVGEIQGLINTLSKGRPIYTLIERGFKEFDINASDSYFRGAENKDTLELHLYVALLFVIARKSLTSIADGIVTLHDWFLKAEKQQDERTHITPMYYFRIMWPVLKELFSLNDLKTLLSKMWSFNVAYINSQVNLQVSYLFRTKLKFTEWSVRYSFELLASTEFLLLLDSLHNDRIGELSKIAASFSKNFVSSDTAEAGSQLITRLDSFRETVNGGVRKLIEEMIHEFSFAFVEHLLSINETLWPLVFRLLKRCKGNEEVLVGLITKKIRDLADSRPNWNIFSSFTVEDINSLGNNDLVLSLLQIIARQLCHRFNGSTTPPQDQVNNLVQLLDQYFTTLSFSGLNLKDNRSYASFLVRPLLRLVDGLKDYETSERRRTRNYHSNLDLKTTKNIGEAFGLIYVLFATESPMCSSILESLNGGESTAEAVALEITEQFLKRHENTRVFQQSYTFVIAEFERYEANSDSVFEPEGENGLSFSRLYLALARGFGEAVSRIDMYQGSKLALVQKQLEKPRMSVVSIFLARSVLDHISSQLQESVLKPGPDLTSLFTLMDKTSEWNIRKIRWKEVFLPSIEEFLQNHRKAIAEQRVSLANLRFLLEKGGDQYLTQLEKEVSGNIDPVECFSTLFDHLLADFTGAQEEQDKLQRVANFLRLRNLLPNHANINAILNCSDSEDDLLLCDLVARNDDIRSEFLNESGEPFAAKTLHALKTFCAKGCAIFATRFDETCARLAKGGTQRLEVDTVTAETLRRLEMLVSAENARVNDFDADLTVIIAEFQEKGHKQSRMQLDLELVVQFFRDTYTQSGDGRDTAQYLTRLQAAFSLLRIRENVTPFLATMEALKLDTLVAQVKSFPELEMIKDNFKIVDAERLLERMQVLLQGLTHWDMCIVGKLTNENELTAQLLLSFFDRTAADFDGALERATNRAAVNAHVVDVLRILPDVRLLLQPLWDLTHKPADLESLAQHFQQHLVWAKRAGSDPVCVSLQELLSVLENWGEVEAFFHDGGGAQTGSEVIERLIHVYRQSGRFYSCDQGVSFKYRLTEAPITLSPDALQIQIQGAVLGTEGKTGVIQEEDEREILNDFVNAYRAARKAHEIRMKLTEAGHPSFQVSFGSTANCFLIASNCVACDVKAAVEEFRSKLEHWQELLRSKCQENPRLLLLGRRSLVQLILTLTSYFDPESPKFLRMLTSYLLLCFPMPFNQRPRFEEVVASAVNRIDIQLISSYLVSGKVTDLFQVIVTLVQYCEENQKELHSLRYAATDSVERLDVTNRPLSDLYGLYLADAFSINSHCAVGQPGTVLWGDRSVTEHTIQEFLALASVMIGDGTLFCSVHVLNVERLTPRMRRELLQGIQNSPLKSQVLLLFGSQVGIDSFSHYRQGEVGTAEKASSCLDSTWATYKDENGEVNASVSVVCGGSGVGKSRWVKERVQGSKVMRVVVHEGFDCAEIIHRFETLQDKFTEGEKLISQVAKVQSVAIHFDVTEYGDLRVLSQFLHHLLVFGTLFDAASGTVSIVNSKLRLSVFIELPSLSEDFGGAWPPADVVRRNERHPFLAELPILSLWCSKYHRDYVFINENSPLLLDSESYLVATYLKFLSDPAVERAAYNFLDPSPLPISQSDTRVVNENECHLTLNSFFTRVAPEGNKRFLSTVVKVLFSRILYFVRIHSAFHREDSKNKIELFRRFFSFNAFEKLLKLFIEESLCIANNYSSSDNIVITIRPQYQSEKDIIPPEALFDAIIASPNGPENVKLKREELMSLFQNCKHLKTEEPEIPSFLRATVAPIFGMKDSSRMLRTLTDLGFVLTSDALMMLVQLHSRRLAGVATILEGETGCGKSQLVKLYSCLINSDSNLFTNVKLHLLALFQVIVSWMKDGLSAEGRALDPDFVKMSDAFSDHSMRESSVPEVINSVIAWVNQSLELNQNILQFVSTLICLYVRALMKAYPLHEKGLNSGAVNTLTRFEAFFTQAARLQGETDLLLALLEQAASTDLLTSEGHRVNQFDFATPEKRDKIEVFPISNENDLREFLTQVLESSPASLFHRKLADEGLDTLKWRSFIQSMRDSALEIQHQCLSACICVFVDELNTAGCMGLVTEALTSHSCDGIPLPPNIFFCGAINPFRPRPNVSGGNIRVMDFTRSNIVVADADPVEDDYLASSPYIVKALAPSLRSSRLSYPSMDKRTEERFLHEYLQSHMKYSAPSGVDRKAWAQEIELKDFYITAQQLIVRAQQLVRGYKIPRVYMSIRNLIRAAELLDWFLTFSVPTKQEVDGRLLNQQNIFLPIQRDQANQSLDQREILQMKKRMIHALIMTVSVVYWFQLPSQGHVAANRCDQDLRTQFITDITDGLDEIGWGRYFFSDLEVDDSVESLEDRNVEKWKKVISNSLNHLWSRAKIPAGLAKTNAMMENFYSIVLCAENKIPLLITGPPGCGKTLSFMLACENLAGKRQQHSVAFQQLKKAQKFMYNCSPESTGPELAARFADALKQQLFDDQRQPRKKVCMVGVDEAGLAPENRQALKSLHDFLDMRQICAVLMSNTTLDAAKTSRTIQLLQTQANLEDLEQFARSILVDNKLRCAPEQLISGLSKAFHELPSDLWFHSRDFAYLCRFLKKIIDDSTKQLPSLFDAPMLLNALRRNFQTLDPSLFPDLARRFLTCCSLEIPADISLEAKVLKHLRDSLSDQPPSDKTDASLTHCRYTMIVDPTDCEMAVDLLFELNLLNHNNTTIISLSDFPEDVDTTNRTKLLAQIFAAIEKGETLLLVNSAPIQASLYDVINRHYSYSYYNGCRVDFTTIALGSFSRVVRVHPNFRLVVHVAQSQLPQTPLPFLNRMEKFTLSVRDVFAERAQEVALNPRSSIGTIRTYENRLEFFSALQAGMEDFLRFCGGKSSFYGLAAGETIPALLLRALEDSCDSRSFTPRPSLLRVIRKNLHTNALRDHKPSAESGDQQERIGGEGEEECVMPSADSLERIPPAAERSPSTCIREIVRALNFQLLETMRVESLFRLRSKLPFEYLREYLKIQEHFTVTQLVSLLIAGRCLEGPQSVNTEQVTAEKLLVYTRTDETIQRLGSDLDPQFARNLFFAAVPSVLAERGAAPETDLNFEVCLSRDNLLPLCKCDERRNVVRIVSLAAFDSSLECRGVISNCLRSNTALLLVVADMDICSAAQVTYARHEVDASLARYSFSSIPCVVFLLHVSAEKLHLRPCYQTIPLKNWHSIYVDSFCNESTSGEHQISLDWLRVAFSQTQMPSLDALKVDFMRSVETSLVHAIHSVQLKQHPVLINKAGLMRSLPGYRLDNKEWTVQLFRSRSFLLHTLSESMARVWMHLLEPTVQQACKRIASGVTNRGLLEVVQLSMQGLLSDFVRYLYRSELASHWNLESIAALPCDSESCGSESQFFCSSGPSIGAIESKDDRTTEKDYRVDINSEMGQSKAALAQHVLRAAVLSYKPDTLSYSCGNFSAEISAGVVNCNKTRSASAMPFFHTFMKHLRAVIPFALSSARKSQIKLDQLQEDITSVHHCLRQRSAWHDLHHAVELIEKNESLWDDWTRDFIAFSLDYSALSPAELTCLRRLLENVVRRSYSDDDRHRNKADAPELVRWMLLESKFKSALYQPARVIITMRLTDENFASDLLTTWQDTAGDVSGASIETSLISHMCRLALDKIWTSTTVPDKEQKGWMHCARDLLSLRIINLTFESTEYIKKKMMISTLFHFSGLLGLNISEVLALPLSVVYRAEIEDPLCFALDLLAAAQYEHQVDVVSSTNFLLVIVDQVVQDQSKFLAESKYLAVLVTCLLQGRVTDIVETTWQYFNIFAELCSQLSVVTRSELIYQLLQGLPCEMEDLIENNFKFMLLESGSVYVPSFLTEAKLQAKGGQLGEAESREEKESEIMRFEDIRAEMIVFRAIFRHVHFLHSSFTLPQLVESYVSSAQNSGNTFFAVREATTVVLLLDSLADFVSRRSGSDPEVQASVTLDMDIMEAVKAIFAQEPTMWPLYFLAKVCIVDLSVALDILLDKAFWERVSLPNWFLAPSEQKEATAILGEAEIGVLREQIKAFELHINYISRVASNIDLKQREAVLYPPCIQQLLQTYRVSEVDDVLQSHAFKTAQMLLDSNNSITLLSNKFIPILHTFSQFLYEKLAYRFTSEEAMTDSTVESALEQLSISDQIIGKKLFSEFLQAWAALQKQFHTFDQCRREAAAANPIPVLTDNKGGNPTYLRYLVPMAQITDTEPLTKRMLDLQLLRQTADLLQHPSVQYLRDDPNLNFSCYLSDSVAPKISLDRFDHDLLSSPINNDLILTGVATNDATVMACSQSLYCSLSWNKEPSTDPAPEKAHQRTKNLRQLLQESKDRIAMDNQTKAHNDGWAICPNCSLVWEREIGCDHVCCGQYNNPYGGGTIGKGHTLGKLGCGRKFNYQVNRVPLPIDGQPLLAHFTPEFASLPSEGSWIATVNLPEQTSLRGSFQVDWLACCRVLLSRCIHGRALLQLGECLKSWLPMSLSLHAEDDGPLSKAFDRVYRTALDRISLELPSELGAANVFIRLRVFAVRMQRNLSIDGMSSSPDATNIGDEMPNLKNFLSRQEERELETIADEIIYLTQRFLPLTSLSTEQPELFSEVKVFCREATYIMEMTIADLISYVRETNHSAPATPRQQWKSGFWNKIKEFPAYYLAEIGMELSMIGIKGFSGTRKLFDAAIPPASLTRLQNFGDTLIADVQLGVSDTAASQTQLQELGYLLSANEKLLATGIDDLPLRDLSIVKDLFSRSENVNLLELIGDLQVKHCGELMCFISRTLALVAYHNLTSASHNPSAPPTGNSASKVYEELVPSCWESIQATSTVTSNLNAADDADDDFVLVQEVVTRDYELFLEEYGEDRVLKVSAEGGSMENKQDETTNLPSDDCTVELIDQRKVMNREKPTVDLMTAWELMSSEQKEKLGATCARDFLELNEDEWNEEVKGWKRIPRNKFLRAMKAAIEEKERNSVESEDLLVIAWDLLTLEERKEMEARSAEDLLELKENDIREVVESWKLIPQKKFLRIMGVSK